MDARPGRRRVGAVMTLLAVVVFVSMVTAVLASRQFAGRGATMLAAATVDVGSLPVTVPLSRSAGQLLIDVSFGDDGPAVPMLLDTGAPTMISEEVAGRLGVSASGSVDEITPDGAQISGHTVALPPVRIGGLKFDHVGAVVVPPYRALALLGTAHGVIGANLMRTAVWQLDFRASLLTIATTVAELDHIDGALRLPFRPYSTSSPSPIVELGVGGRRVAFLVDTGFDGGLAVHPADLTGGGQPPRRSVILTSERLTEGLGLMGLSHLSGHVLTIDWASETLYLDPQPHQRDEPGH